MSELYTYDILLKISEGDESMIPKLYELNDNVKIRFNKKNPKKSLLTFHFKNDEYFKIFYDSEDARFVNELMNYYDYDVVGYQMFDNEWEEGYMLGSILSKDIIEKIVRNTDPTFKIEKSSFGFENSQQITNLLSENYPRECDDIVSEYESVINTKLKNEYENTIKSDLSNKLMSINIFEIDEFTTYVTNLQSFIKLYNNLKSSYSKELDISEVLTEYGTDMDIARNFYENIYEDAYNINPNPEFNESISWALNSMLEKSEEKFESLEGMEEIRKMIDVIADMGGFNVWIDLSKENRKIKFTKINYDNQSIEFLITKKSGQDSSDYDGSSSSIAEPRSVKTLEELNQTLYHPELFESLDLIHDLIITEQLQSNLNKGLFKQFYLENDELFNGEPRPISDLKTAINNFNSSNKSNVNLNLDTLLKMSKEKNPMFKLDLFFINNGKMERPLWGGNLEFGNDMKFTLSRTPNNNFVPGIKLTF